MRSKPTTHTQSCGPRAFIVLNGRTGLSAQVSRAIGAENSIGLSAIDVLLIVSLTWLVHRLASCNVLGEQQCYSVESAVTIARCRSSGRRLTPVWEWIATVSEYFT